MEAGELLNILGLQKLTLLDYPDKVACTVFTGGCNLRCPFCHNSSLVIASKNSGAMNEADLFIFLKKRQGFLDGVCVTGGEPLLQSDIVDLLRQIKALGYLIKLDTNGTFPDRLKELVTQGLVDYVAMDIKSSPGHYGKATGVSRFDFSKVSDSINYLLAEPVDYEFRTTVVKGLHDVKIMHDIAQTICGAKRYYLQKFVDSGDLIGTGMSVFSDGEVKMFLDDVAPFVKTAALRGL